MKIFHDMNDKIITAVSLSGLSLLNAIGIAFDEWAGRISVFLGILSALIIMRYYWYKGNQAKNESRPSEKESPPTEKD